MIEDLFKPPTILARYRAGPLPEAREEFLEHCAKEGYSRSMLRKIARVLLAVAHNVDTDHGNMSTRDIERAVDSRVRFSRWPLRTKESLWTRQMFIHFATEWLRRLGCLQDAPGAQNAFAAQIDAFVGHMRDERGLSPVTISTRCERLAWFVRGLCPPRDTLATIIGSPLGLRDRAMTEVLYSTGMRCLGLAHLEVSDVDFERGAVLIRQGKGKKDRMIPLGARAGAWVRRYLESGRPALLWNEREPTLFLSREGGDEPRLAVVDRRRVRRARRPSTAAAISSGTRWRR